MKNLCITILCVFGGKLLFAQQFTNSTLPILVITTPNSTPIPDEPKAIGHLGIIWNGDGAINHLTTDPFNEYDGQIGVEIRGSSSQSFPKKGYAVETQHPDGTSDNVSLLGFPKENDWILYGPYTDKTLMRDALAFTMAGWIMPYAPRVKFCELVINGDYVGVYMFTEKIKRDDNRVNISKLEPTDIAGDALTGGYMLKFDKFDGISSEGFASTHPSMPGASPGTTVYQYHYPKPEDITYQQKAYIQNYIANFENIMSAANYADPITGYPSVLDVESVIQLTLIEEISRNVDGYRLSTFMYKDRESIDNRLHLGPVWDFNLGFGNVDYCIGPDYKGWAVNFNNFCPDDYWIVHFWWNKLWKDKAFLQKMRDDWVALRADKFSNENVLHLVDSLENLLAVPAQRNFQRWPILNQYVWPNPVITGSYAGEVEHMRTWLLNRMAWMDGAFEDLVEVDTTIVVDPPGNELPIAVPSLFHDKVEFYFTNRAYQRNELEIFDAQGKRVSYQKQYFPSAGVVKMEWDGSNLPVGMYFYKLKAGKTMAGTGKLMKF